MFCELCGEIPGPGPLRVREEPDPPAKALDGMARRLLRKTPMGDNRAIPTTKSKP